MELLLGFRSFTERLERLSDSEMRLPGFRIGRQGLLERAQRGLVAVERVQRPSMVVTRVRELRIQFARAAKRRFRQVVLFLRGIRYAERLPGLRLFRARLRSAHQERNRGGSLRSEERRVGKECRSRWSPY